MKHLNLAICLIIISFAFHSCNQGQSDQNSAQRTATANSESFIVTSQTPLRASANHIREYMTQVIPNKKTKIDNSVAAVKLGLFKYWADEINRVGSKPPVNWTDASYGFLFNFDELYKYMDSIKTANVAAPADKKVDGIRVYLGASHYKSGFVPDVFLFPTNNGKNVKPIDRDYQLRLEKLDNDPQALFEELMAVPLTVGDGSGFNSSFPCPQSCP